MRQRTSITLFFICLLAIGTIVFPLLSPVPLTPLGSEQGSPVAEAQGEIHLPVQGEAARSSVEGNDATVTIEIVGAADIDALLSVSAWATLPRGRLWEKKISPTKRLVKHVPPDQDIQIAINKSQFGDAQSRHVRLSPGENTYLVFDMAMPVALNIQLAGMPS